MCLDRLQLSACAFARSALLAGLAAHQAPPAARFSVLAFYTGRDDLAHVSFVGEANRWFPETARAHGFGYESTTDWTRLNAELCRAYQVVCSSIRGPTIRRSARRSGITWRTAARGWDFISPASR